MQTPDYENAAIGAMVIVAMIGVAIFICGVTFGVIMVLFISS